jgi:hypothetical protein
MGYIHILHIIHTVDIFRSVVSEETNYIQLAGASWRVRRDKWWSGMVILRR